MDAFSTIPEKEDLINWFKRKPFLKKLLINSHVHTPYSFSAFEKIDDIFVKAQEENINVLGINDFFVSDGYADFYRLATQYRIFPLFNIEFIGLLEREQQNSTLVNDPKNPGRTYFSGKGLRYPFTVSASNNERLQDVRNESQQQVLQMIEKLRLWLNELHAPFDITYGEIKTSLAKELVRERHIAKMLRIKINESFKTEAEKEAFLSSLYSGRECKANLNSNASLEEELRGNLLKSGGVAFVSESPDAFLPLHEIAGIIKEAGGIPCYPVLLDDKNGNFTGFEADFKRLCDRLRELNVGMIELIPGRNDLNILTKFVKYFDEAGFVIVFGTEHNTPEMMPLTVKARGNVPLGNELKLISEHGTCLVAAHQYLVSKGYPGIIDSNGEIATADKNDLVTLGRAVIEKFITE
ncbi:MAG: PHP domain-containing protein [Bacteroidales bacterium]|nr:PHP domain-containing protein [Bacteroidales bacterium]MBN2764594.1 PHP domain-containing protein [Bacteroidales bacterium]